MLSLLESHPLQVIESLQEIRSGRLRMGACDRGPPVIILFRINSRVGNQTATVQN
jgi:hypothetical protein